MDLLYSWTNIGLVHRGKSGKMNATSQQTGSLYSVFKGEINLRPAEGFQHHLF